MHSACEHVQATMASPVVLPAEGDEVNDAEEIFLDDADEFGDEEWKE